MVQVIKNKRTCWTVPNGLTMALLQTAFIILVIFGFNASEPTTFPPTIPTEMPDTSMSCDFDKNSFCSWTPEKGSLEFMISVPYKARDKMPKFDHTKGNYQGRYAYVQGDSISGKRAALSLRSVPEDFKGDFCFSMWYFMNVEGISKLTVAAEHRASNWAKAYVPFWTRSTNAGYRWRHAYVHIKSSETGPKMRIYAVIKTGVIALDDLAGKAGPCPHSKICTFDDDDNMCNYTQGASNSLDWDVKTGDSIGVRDRMPDHTTRTIEGSYMYIGFNGTSQEKSQLSRIYSPERAASATSNCVTFYYHIYNVSKLSFNTYLATDNELLGPQWTMSVSQGLMWHGARFSVLLKRVSWQVVFEVAVGSHGYGQVAIDDISITVGSCPSPGYCNFETEDCLWENVPPPFDGKEAVQYLGVQKAGVANDMLKDDLDWVRHIGEDYFGPHRDKSLGSPQGFYLLLDSRYATAGQKAVYVSEKLQSAGSSCLRLWYATPNFRNGASMEVLSSSDFITAKQEKLIRGTTNDVWTEALTTILPPASSDFLEYWIFLAGYVGEHTLGYIAVDDIRLQDGVCEEGNDTDIVKGNVTSRFAYAEVRKCTARSVTFYIATSGPVKYIEANYREGKQPSNATTIRLAPASGNIYEIGNLLPSGLYSFQFRTVPSESDDWSRQYNITLLPDAPEIIWLSIGNGNVRLQWFTKTDDVLRGTIDRYQIKYFSVQMVGGNSWTTSNCSVTIEVPTCVASSYTIWGLEQTVFYQIEVRAHTEAGYGEPTSQKVYLP